ncbi:MAG: 3D domain-containing protein, partial [bacterium]|nr:3D domain-containing protein [bacterium]
THVRDGVVAANFLPLGTIIKIPEIFGDKVFVIEDRMNKRYDYRIDLWFSTRAEAKEWGVRKIKIEIVS